MIDDQSSREVFDAAADRRAYEKSRLPPILARKVAYIEQKADAEKERCKEKQDARREQDLAEERTKQRLEHPTKTYEDLTLAGVRKPPSEEQIERLAVHAVDRRNDLALAAIDLARDEKVDSVLALNRETQAHDRDGATPDLLDSRKDIDIGGDFYRANGPER